MLNLSYSFTFFEVLGFELRASHLLGRCLAPTIWAMPPALLALVILELGSCHCPSWPALQSSYFTLPTLARITSTHCHTWLTHRVLKIVWLGTLILPISASWLAWDDRCTPLRPAIGWDGFQVLFALACLQLQCLLILASLVARITGVSHQHLAIVVILHVLIFYHSFSYIAVLNLPAKILWFIF
jgi:hypothetical protein